MSINDVPEIREMFAWARIEEVSTTYTVGKQTVSRGERRELLIEGSATAREPKTLECS